MRHLNHLAEQHALLHAAHLRQVDETTGPVGHPGPAPEAHAAYLDRLAREELASAGPMGIWDVMAQQLEKVVERLEQ